MAWEGYFEYAGAEIINVTRTETYVKNAGHTWFRPLYEADALPFMLGDGKKYRTALLDDAPWVDPDAPESTDFYGFYPLGVTGIEDSTRESTVTQSLGNGGTPGRLRHGTKTAVFNGILVARTEAGAEYGMRWLRAALLGGACGATATSTCNGLELCYLVSEPDMEVPEATVVGSVQALLDGGFFVAGDPLPLSVVDGEVVNQPPATIDVDGGVVNQTTFTDSTDGGSADATSGTLTNVPIPIEADDPDLDGGPVENLYDGQFDGGTPTLTGGFFDGREYPFNLLAEDETLEDDPEDCLTPYLRKMTKVVINDGPSITAKRIASDGGNIWTVQFTAVAGSPYEYSAEVPIITGFLDPEIEVPWATGIEPDSGLIDLDGYIHDEAACAVPQFSPVYDPLYPTLIPPPGPPSVPLGNYNPPLNWLRRQFTIPKQYVPLWGEVVPKVSVHARDADLRNLRLRFYADPYNIGSIEDDPCAFCGDIVISYVPKDHSLVLDGSTQTVYVLTPGGDTRRADSLVFKTDGTPFEWPTLSCGFGYIVTLDLPQTQPSPVVDLSLFSRMV
jgi:hypothetical protein